MESPVIETQLLSKYYGRVRGIENLDLCIREGEVFGFIGPNGAGKSTTIRILLNLIFPTSGTAKILGLDAIRDTQRIKAETGYIPSDANPYPAMRVDEFLQYCLRFYPGRYDTERIRKLCAWFELDERRKIAELSMGNRKKVAIVQSLVHRPRLLILDEPTTGLDPLMQARFFELLRKENEQGLTIFFSSHILSEVQKFCKRVAIIREGKIIRTEEVDNLRKKQLKKVSVNFENPAEAVSFSIAGMEKVQIHQDEGIDFMFAGDINLLTARLSSMRIVNLTLEEPSLEEIFMHYYQ